MNKNELPKTVNHSKIPLNIVAKFCNVGFGDQVLAVFTQICFAKQLCEQYPDYFEMKQCQFYHDYGQLKYYSIDKILNFTEDEYKQFIPWRTDENGKRKLINKPPRLYQCNVFKPLSKIRSITEGSYPIHFNVVTRNQSHIPMFMAKPSLTYIEDPMFIYNLICKYNIIKRNIWISLDYRVLGTFQERVDFSKAFLKDPLVPLDTFTKQSIDTIKKFNSENCLTGCIHIRLTDCTLIQCNDADPTKNGKIVETCLGPLESEKTFTFKLMRWIELVSEKYSRGIVYVFSDDPELAKVKYNAVVNALKPKFEIVWIQRDLYTMFCQSWKDYLIMRECNEHCVSVSMFSLWGRSYHNYFEEVHTHTEMAFTEDIVYAKN